MKRKKLKKSVKIVLGVLIVVIMSLSIILLSNNTTKQVYAPKDYVYVNDYIFDNYSPTISTEESIKKPYNSNKVSIYKNYYEKDDTDENQQKSIIYHENIYMQNSGVDYTSDEQFDVISSLSGEVTNITDDSLLGKTVEVKNTNEIIVLYQSLGEVFVKKGDTISQGQIIAKSGVCKLNEEVKNGLHFEIYVNGSVVNPEKTYNKQLKEIITD